MRTLLFGTLLCAVVGTVFSCDQSVDPKCKSLCEHLRGCDLLPSALGIGRSPESREENCESRCSAALEQEKNNTNNDPDAGQSDVRNILACEDDFVDAADQQLWCKEKAQCQMLSACLQALLPAAGGVSQIVVQAFLADTQDPADADAGVDADEGEEARGCLDGALKASETTADAFCGAPIAEGAAGAGGVGGDSGNQATVINSVRLLLPAGAELVDDGDLTLKCDEALARPFPPLSVPAGQRRLRFKILSTRTEGGAVSPLCNIVESDLVQIPAGRTQTVRLPIPAELLTSSDVPQGPWTVLPCEICTDGQDDDKDGFTDCADEACQCEPPPDLPDGGS